MKLNNTIFLFLVSLVFTSCNNDSEPLLTKFIIEGARNTTEDYLEFDKSDVIQFTNLSQNAMRYEWDFGDGTTSTEANPTHKYELMGMFEVTLTAYNIDGDVSKFNQKVNILLRNMQYFRITSSKKELPSHLILFLGEVNNLEKAFVYALPASTTHMPVNSIAPFTSSKWFLMIIQNYPPYERFDEQDQLVFGTTFYPASAEATNYIGKKGEIIISETKNNEGAITEDFTFQIDFALYNFF